MVISDTSRVIDGLTIVLLMSEFWARFNIGQNAKYHTSNIVRSLKTELHATL